jgi:hypothetical protein
MTFAYSRSIAIGVVLIALLMATTVVLQRVRDGSFPLRSIDEDSLYLSSPTAARRIVLGYRAVAADVYWIRALQYFGGTRRMVEAGQTITNESRRRYAALYPLLELTTSLDPRFNLAYRFGAIFLAEPAPRGPGRPDLAIALLMKALVARPDRWEYMHDIGFVHYWWRQDYKAAAEWFQRASEAPRAPWWLKSLAATTIARGGDRQSSRLMWEAIRQSAEIDWLRNEAERRLAQLKALDDIDAIQAIVDRVAAETAQPVHDWRPVVRAAGWRGVPVDPAGEPYEIDEQGRVRLSRASPLWPLPAEETRIDPAAGPP